MCGTVFICYGNIQEEVIKCMEKLEGAKFEQNLKNKYEYAWKKKGIECSCQRKCLEQDTNIYKKKCIYRIQSQEGGSTVVSWPRAGGEGQQE